MHSTSLFVRLNVYRFSELVNAPIMNASKQSSTNIWKKWSRLHLKIFLVAARVGR
jgi:hypothetical protein